MDTTRGLISAVDSRLCVLPDDRRAVKRVGWWLLRRPKESSTKVKKEILSVSGMACDECVAQVTRALTAVKGVATVHVSKPAATATVTYDEQIIKAAELRAAVEAAGYGVDGSIMEHIHHSDGACCCGPKAAARARESTASHAGTAG